MFASAKEIMDWLAECAKLVATEVDTSCIPSSPFVEFDDTCATATFGTAGECHVVDHFPWTARHPALPDNTHAHHQHCAADDHTDSAIRQFAGKY